MATTSRRATEADLWDHSARGERCELVDGEIRAMSTAGGIHGKVCVRLAGWKAARFPSVSSSCPEPGSSGSSIPVRAP